MTDEEMMEAVKTGDLLKLGVLFERHNKAIFNFLARMTMDRDLAEDLTQNVFLRIIKYKASYRSGLRFQSWLYQVARNVFSDHYQKHKNKVNNFIDVEKIGHTIVDDDGGHQQLEREVLLERSLALLPDEQRELLVLTRFQHLKYEQVAAIMNTTEANIKVKVHRAIARLREHYFELEKLN